MSTVERRAARRIRPPVDAVLDFALWPTGVSIPYTLPLAALASPAAAKNAGQTLTLVDVASIGLGVHLVGTPGLLRRLAESPALYVYLKLRAKHESCVQPPLSLFFHVKTIHTGPGPEELAMGLQVLHLGRGSAFEKSLEFLDVSRFGIKALADWIDALHTGGSTRAGGLSEAGLNLDNLLDEPELVTVQS